MTESTTDAEVVLITGTSSGIGRRMAETFARAGHRVFAGMRDVTDDAQVEAAVARILEQAGRIDVLVNNAGLSVIGISECSTLEQARQAFEVNDFGPLRLCRAVLPGMRRRRARDPARARRHRPSLDVLRLATNEDGIRDAVPRHVRNP
jgi:NAD(P)-dependent dehydrogenase (short-subunit alcohol dehydrogenase family)